MTWQLWLAKDLIEECHLPWQSQAKKLTPGRVAQSIYFATFNQDWNTWFFYLILKNKTNN